MNMDYEACPGDAYGHDTACCAPSMNETYDANDMQSMCNMSDMQNVYNMNDMQGIYNMDPCSCMQEDLCPALPLAQAYVRPQPFGRTFAPREALKCGTLFPELVSHYK